MKLIKLSTIAITGCLALAALTPAQARDDDRRHDRRGPDRVIVIRDDHRGRHDDRHRWDGRRNDRADHHHGRGHGHGPRWSRGDRVPHDYRGRQYVVNDWRGHRLAPPPRGAQWVGVGADYLLIGIATGVVMQAVLAR